MPEGIVDGFDKVEEDAYQGVLGPYVWKVLFKEPEDRAFWALYGTDLNLRSITFRYATGWTSYTSRIGEMLGTGKVNGLMGWRRD